MREVLSRFPEVRVGNLMLAVQACADITTGLDDLEQFAGELSRWIRAQP